MRVQDSGCRYLLARVACHVAHRIGKQKDGHADHEQDGEQAHQANIGREQNGPDHDCLQLTVYPAHPCATAHLKTVHIACRLDHELRLRR